MNSTTPHRSRIGIRRLAVLAAAAGSAMTAGSVTAAAQHDHATVPPTVADTCAAYFELSAQFGGEPDPAVAGAALDALEANLPTELEATLGVMIAAGRQAIDTEGADASAFETPEFDAAISAADVWMFDNCEFDTKLEVNAVDYHFEGIPAEIPAGRIGVLVTNTGTEAHEMIVLGKNEGVTEPWSELLELPEDEAMTKAVYVGGAFVARNGTQRLALLDLEPGDYAAFCFIPMGSSVSADGAVTEGTGAPHFVAGMTHEFTVTAAG